LDRGIFPIPFLLLQILFHGMIQKLPRRLPLLLKSGGKMLLIAARIIDALIGPLLLDPFEVLLGDFREQGSLVSS